MASTARIDELRKKFDENPRRYFAPLANEFRKAGEIEQAIMICEEFLPQQPGHMSGHIVYGQALFEASRFEDARTVFETALTLDPENLIALRHLGDIARGQGDAEAARRWYDRVLEADPRNEEIQALIALLVSDGASGGSPAAPSETRDATASEESTSASSWDASPPVPPPLPTTMDLDATSEFAPPSVRHASPSPESVVPTGESGRAEGLESVEFSPLTEPVDAARDLGSSLEPAEFTRPSSDIEPIAGLEETSVGAFERNTPDGGPDLIMLDTSEPAPSRDTLENTASGPSTPAFERADDPDLAARGMIAPPTADRGWDLPPDLPPELPRESPPAAEDVLRIPPELPPSVIAAEAALMDFGDPLPDTTSAELPDTTSAPMPASVAAESPAPSSAPIPAPVPALTDTPFAEMTSPAAAPFVTETMAELFMKQGLRDQALAVYRQLLSAKPGDQRLAARIAELQPANSGLAGQSIRDFLARFAALRPGQHAAAAALPSHDDFATGTPAAAPELTWEVAPEPEPAADPAPPSWTESSPAEPPGAATEQDVAPPLPRPTPTSVMSTGIERGAATQAGGGSIDALFGTRATRTSEDSAASALAQAFGGGAESSPVISGRPARAAAGELSLDSVFRGGAPRPPRAAQNFSFDEFFAPDASARDQPAVTSSPSTPAASDPSAATEPAERNADDIEQFNSWLQGLKPK